MKKSIKDLAVELTQSAQKPFTCGIPPKDIKGDMTLKSVIVDYQDYFGKYTFGQFKEFCKECDELGFDVLPIEHSQRIT